MNIHPFPNAVNYFLRYYFIPLKKYTTLLIFYSALPQLRLQNFNRARNCTKFVKYPIRSIVYFYLYVYEKPSDFITRHPHRHHRPPTPRSRVPPHRTLQSDLPASGSFLPTMDQDRAPPGGACHPPRHMLHIH